MIKLLVIADDFTGALDTAVQFTKKGVATMVLTDGGFPTGGVPCHMKVLVVNSESRHLPPGTAYRLVYEVAHQAKLAGVPHIYKKTDSALRGNIGAELSAVMDAYGSTPLYFLPAFPSMGRVTKNGAQFIDGVPVNQSVFGRDPFEPVMDFDIGSIIRRQSNVPVYHYPAGRLPGLSYGGIHVADAETDTDLLQACTVLQKNGPPPLLGGCAGFAACLPELLGLPSEMDFSVLPFRKILVLSGSINPVTFKQTEHAGKNGFLCITLEPKQKLTEGFFSTPEGQHFVSRLEEALGDNRYVLVASARTEQDVAQSDAVAQMKGLIPAQAGGVIARNMGALGAEICKRHPDLSVFIIGGDTLGAFLHSMGSGTIFPQGELLQGIVQSLIYFNNEPRAIVTKSGGFSDENALIESAEILTRCEK